MPHLKIFYHRDHIASLPLSKPMIRIGRGPDNDFILTDPVVSSTHLILRKRGAHWMAENASENGVESEDGPLIAPQFRWELGKSYRIGSHTSLQLVESPSTPPERTCLRTGDLTEHIVLSSDAHSLSIAQARLNCVSLKPQKSVAITRTGLSLGRHPSNDWVIDDPKVSQFHARLVVDQNAYQFSDLGSTNGSFVDGIRIQRARLNDNHKICLGQHEFVFSLEKETLRIPRHNRTDFFGMRSQNSKMRRLFDLAETIAPLDLPVLISGETGTGKELLARALHSLSGRSEGEFVAINCAALPKELAESELFGHEKGAFTGAQSERRGAFERASQGSLFLDEIGELDLGLQAKILRVLELGEYQRVGADETRHSRARIIAASHRQLEHEVERGSFREDLYYRLHVLPMELPPLRERKDDIPLLVDTLLKQVSENGSASAQVIAFLQDQYLPGNIRELKNILARAAIQAKLRRGSQSDRIELEDLDFLDEARARHRLQNSKERQMKTDIQAALEANHFNQSRAAESLKLPISTLHDRIRRYGISLPKAACKNRLSPGKKVG